MNNDDKSNAWYKELEEDTRKLPDRDKHECCMAIVLGDLDALGCDVHVGNFNGIFKIPIEYCPYCGTDLQGLREVVMRKYQRELDTLQHGGGDVPV